MSNLVIVNDETEVFTPSHCDCAFCNSVHSAVAEWDNLVPKTIGQRHNKMIVDRISERETQRHVQRLRQSHTVVAEPVLRRSSRLANKVMA